MPHAPQFWTSLRGSEHVPVLAQNVVRAGQRQAPEMQNSPPPQGRPHAPQFAVSAFRSAQLLAHAASPPAHVHLPAVQASPGPHAAPHAPQFCVFDVRSAHAPLQLVVPTGQLHLPALHT